MNKDLFGKALKYIQDNDLGGYSFSLGQTAHLMAAFAKEQLEELEESKKPNIQHVEHSSHYYEKDRNK